jgi:hypothetical protein
MKKMIIVLLLGIVLSGIAMADDPDTVTVPKTMLTKEQLSDITAKELQDKVDKYGKWVGVGHELGVAVNESLSAVTTQASNFAQTPVGKWTMFLVIWKVIGKDIQAWIYVTLSCIIGLPFWIWSYRKYLPHQVLVSEEYIGDAKKPRKTYRIYPYGKDEYADSLDWRIGHVVLLVLYVASCLFAVFGD